MNKYFPAGYENIDDLPEESMMTQEALFDTLSDFADEFGDQKLIATIEKWFEKKMGGPWVVGRYNGAGEIEMLAKLLQRMRDLKTNSIEGNKIIMEMLDIMVEEAKSL